MNKQPRPIDWRKVTLASVFSAVILIDAIKLIDFQTTSNCRKQVDLASLRETGIELTRPGGGQTVDDNVLARKIAAGLELMQQTTYGKRILERVDPETGVRMDFLCTDYTAYYNPTSYRNPMAYHSRAKNGIYICRSGLDDGIAATMAHEARHSLFPKIGSQDTVSMRLSMHLLDEMIAYGTGTRVAFEAEEIAPGAWEAFKN
ncbi:MAG: hypothetical protein U9N14_05295, partial [Pseudomonadota bacterium]|nr:hypothetical protein [Pseudomonadota bacterium]